MLIILVIVTDKYKRHSRAICFVLLYLNIITIMMLKSVIFLFAMFG